MQKFTLTGWVVVSVIFGSVGFAADSSKLVELMKERADAISAFQYVVCGKAPAYQAETMLRSTADHIRDIDQQIKDITGTLPDESFLMGAEAPNGCRGMADRGFSDPWAQPDCVPGDDMEYGKFNDAPFSGVPTFCGGKIGT